MSLREQLQAVYEEFGQLTPELVVQAARPKGHPLHHRVFDRPPGEAAESWYRHRAHELIQSVKVVYREADELGGERRVRAFVPVQGEGPSSFKYEPVEVAALDPFMRQLVLRNMEREWKALFARYERFEEFAALVASDLEVKERAA